MARKKIEVKPPKPVAVGRVHARPRRGPRGAGEWYWQARVHEDGASRTVWTGWATAEGIVREIAGLVARDGLAAPAPKPAAVVTVRDLMETWIAAQKSRADIAANTLLNYELAARHVASALGDVRLDRLDLAALERFRDQRLRGGASTGTVSLQVGVLAMAWTWGRQLGACPARDLPKLGMKFKPAANRNRHTPSPEDVVKVIGAMDGWARLATHLLFATGARMGVVAALRWRDVDFENEEVHLRGKTGERSFPLPPPVVEELRRWGPGELDAGLFGTKGITVYGGLRSKYLPRACDAAGVRPFSPHGLRRAAVDALLRAGIDVGTAASLLGHSPKVMLQHYRQSSTDDRQKAVAAARLGYLPEGRVIPFARGG